MSINLGKILLAEDDEALRGLFVTALRHFGYLAYPAADGIAAEREFLAHSHEICAAVLDVRMPERDGPQTLLALRKIRRSLPCCFITAHAGPYSVEDLLAFGGTEVLLKPFRLETLAAVLKRMCKGPIERIENVGCGEFDQPKPNDLDDRSSIGIGNAMRTFTSVIHRHRRVRTN